MKKDDEEKKMAMIIGSNILETRKSVILKRVTQAEVANEVGISRSRYMDIEKGKVVPKVTVLLKIAKFFDVKVDSLLEGVEV